MNFVNLTPHSIALNDGRVFPASGIVARVSTAYSEPVCDVAEVSFGALAGLPEPQDCTIYIASALVSQAARMCGRIDVVSPATGHPLAVRNSGQVVSVPFFVITENANSNAAATLGRKGGKVGGKATSEAKRAAVRANGAKGGRPLDKSAKIARIFEDVGGYHICAEDGPMVTGRGHCSKAGAMRAARELDIPMPLAPAHTAVMRSQSYKPKPHHPDVESAGLLLPDFSERQERAAPKFIFNRFLS